jgi:hypothetical protein
MLGMDLTTRQTELVVLALIDTGLQDVCDGLVNFWTIALVLPTEDSEAPVVVLTQAGQGIRLDLYPSTKSGSISFIGTCLLCALHWHAPTPVIQQWWTSHEACAT